MTGRRLAMAILALPVAVMLATCGDPRAARVLNPEDYGMTCTTDNICIDDTSRLPQAVALRREGVNFVTRTMSAFRDPPKVLFCATDACFANFASSPRQRGLNVGLFGAVIGPRGWQDFTVRHELIHVLQNEHFGVWQASNALPRWFIEGMAYARSGDPRRPLPGAQIQGYRAQYEAWIAAGNVWNAAPKQPSRPFALWPARPLA